ncbi:hypothetical protein K4L44_02690 [Halosquirtibacter laminarini]|uniref:Uncharacterized protein n=1 Tax=Halosquirtibacter laminarini TaxID=3374600 RepID=A0AC61NGM1_9BACT|nr:hypothetical protein K4L44_02690 [Prolixibacteraceae bacterium]
MTFYFLSTCTTCKRIMNEVALPSNTALQDIKKEMYSKEQLEEMRALTGSYEALFNKRAQKYKQLGLKDKNLSEEQIKEYILGDYTFLKRPVFIDHENIFIGNQKKTVESLKIYLEQIS